ncbi:dTMP kinase [Campylobacter sp.]|uniref:dTMP kinase n=1 Tax=Campylobacter sp. TaxID=205 RepID=UPI0026DCD0B3|nr:dTMP kinase [Campylobacter sp.]MDO4674505.1 dTMP kinase [Campylobacter sp.]
MYVVFEGIDGVGKSTQIELLRPIYPDAIFTLEPGGTALGRHLRELLLDKPYALDKRTEFFLFLSDRARHYEEVLRPNQNRRIISDRSCISGMAYAKEFELETLFFFNQFALDGFFPQKVVFLKADAALIQTRLHHKRLDSIERLGVEHFLAVQDKLEKVLNFLKKQIFIKILSLDAGEDRDLLSKKIKDFIDD